MRLRSRVDANQAEITAALRKIGASVQPIHTLGRGVPDLLVCFLGVLYLIEVKDGNQPPSRQRLTDDERKWRVSWGGPVYMARSVDEALRIFGVEEKCPYLT